MERMLSLYDLSKPGSITDWGQTTTFMAVILGLVARSIYLFYAKFKCRSCLERTKFATEFSKSSIARKNNLSAEDFETFESKWKSFQAIRKVLESVDCVRKKLPDQVWYEHIDLEKVEVEFLRSASFNDVNGLIEFAKYIPDLSTAVDEINRTALHIALDKNNTEAIETIMELLDRKPLPEDSSTSPGKKLERLLYSMDETKRTPWTTIMPSEWSQIKPEVLEAFLRFKRPVGPADKSLSLLQTINMVFALPYSLEIMKDWVKAAEDTRSLRQLENGIIQAVETDNRDRTKETQQATESVFEFCCWQYDVMNRTEFADRLFRAFVHSPLRSSVPMPERIALRLLEFLQEKRAWAIESYIEIARLIAWKCEESLMPIRLLLAQHSKDSHFEEQILVGVISNQALSALITDMIWENWPDQVAVTSKVLEACLVIEGPDVESYFLLVLLEKRPHQIRITESILMFAAQTQRHDLWKVLIKKYRSQITMTPDIFNTVVGSISILGRHQDITALFRSFLKEWPDETKITNELLLTILRRGDTFLKIFSEMRHDELGALINGEILVSSIKEHGERDLLYNSVNRSFLDALREEYPQEYKASITDEVLESIENMVGNRLLARCLRASREDGQSVKDYFRPSKYE
jgi:ankyrin repeat protein